MPNIYPEQEFWYLTICAAVLAIRRLQVQLCRDPRTIRANLLVSAAACRIMSASRDVMRLTSAVSLCAAGCESERDRGVCVGEGCRRNAHRSIAPDAARFYTLFNISRIASRSSCDCGFIMHLTGSEKRIYALTRYTISGVIIS